MKTEDLIKVWDAPDNSKLTPKQMSIRLPLHVAASISALAEMYPRKTKTDIIGDLLASSIEQIRNSLPDTKEIIHSDDGTRREDHESPYEQFINLEEKYLKELEKEIGQNKAKSDN